MIWKVLVGKLTFLQIIRNWCVHANLPLLYTGARGDINVLIPVFLNNDLSFCGGVNLTLSFFYLRTTSEILRGSDLIGVLHKVTYGVFADIKFRFRVKSVQDDIDDVIIQI